MRWSDSDHLRYLRHSIERIRRWSAPGREAVIADEITFEAIVHRLETLSDLTPRLSDALKHRHPEIPWRAIDDFRNRLAHGHLDVRAEREWDVSVTHLPVHQSLVDQVVPN